MCQSELPVKNTFIHFAAAAADTDAAEGGDRQATAVTPSRKKRSLGRGHTDPCPPAPKSPASPPHASNKRDDAAELQLPQATGGMKICLDVLEDDLASTSTPDVTPRWSSSSSNSSLPLTPATLLEAGASAWSLGSPDLTLQGAAEDLFEFTIRKADEGGLGLEIALSEDERELLVVDVQADGAVAAWNRQCVWAANSLKMVVPGDRLLRVNGREGGEAMVRELKERRLLRLCFARSPTGMAPAYSTPRLEGWSYWFPPSPQLPLEASFSGLLDVQPAAMLMDSFYASGAMDGDTVPNFWGCSEPHLPPPPPCYQNPQEP
eukprot:TRINITY_DN114756_c0_g1_i1.p1 TRINITY_DN114756_c0_g1~~TRINITY_DN114756_c0_g1_i1.p1  ORF type:complete len:320 (-),score=74.74 TRINITY_DN114756_c0_g1_i1:186-1145(-)